MEPPGSSAHPAWSSGLIWNLLPRHSEAGFQDLTPTPLAPKAGPLPGSTPNWYNPVPGSFLSSLPSQGA